MVPKRFQFPILLEDVTTVLHLTRFWIRIPYIDMVYATTRIWINQKKPVDKVNRDQSVCVCVRERRG